ncbi:MAG TPA: Stk1 family PASTA domain-containing Ser/Thr kinase [Ruminiclostridium sp.]|nr:Stk1 family PASTA domain-containing Ser/Thr kinase [Ruminiclostridium sp.]
MDNIVGRKLDGRYEIQEIIGVGGMAVVYKAYDSIDDRIVAIKVLKEEYLQNEEFRRRFKNESKAVAVLSHPNIVKVYDVSFGDRLQYIVMEYIDGITLKEYIEQQKVLTWKETVHFTVQILRALSHAHERGIVHRDIKPQNIMMLEDGTIKVTDFGIARFAQSETKTMTDKAIGSVHYISPEQARGSITDAKADIYSVGVMLYEMLTGKLPFESDSAVSVAIMQMQEEPKPPRSLNPDIPEGLEDITLRAMQKEPDRRYGSASQMLEDIERFKRNPSIHFQYKYFVDESPTKYIDAINDVKGFDKPNSIDKKFENGKNSAKPKKKQNTLPILAGITAALVIVVVAVIIVAMALRGFFGGGTTITVPNLVGQQYNDVKANAKYSGFEIVEKTTEFNNAPEGQIISQDPQANSKVKKNSKINVVVSKGAQEFTVPDVYGQDKDDAVSTLQSQGFTNVKVQNTNDDSAKNTVISTSPARGEKASKDEEITVLVSLGPKTVVKTVPDVSGMSKDAATRAIQDAGFVADAQEEYSDSVAQGQVTRQNPASGTQLTEKSTVTFWISKGKPTPKTTVPNVVGETLYKATQDLGNAQLSLGTVYGSQDSNGIVTKQSAAANSQVDQGTAINLTVSPPANGSSGGSNGSGNQ